MVGHGLESFLMAPQCFQVELEVERVARAVEGPPGGAAPNLSTIAEPRGMVAVSVTCAETTEEAERLAWSRWSARIIGAHGIGGGIPSPEEAMAFAYTAPEREYIEELRRHAIFGDPERVRMQLTALADEYETDEVMAVTITYDFAARRRSYELLAEAFGLADPG